MRIIPFHVFLHDDTFLLLNGENLSVAVVPAASFNSLVQIEKYAGKEAPDKYRTTLQLAGLLSSSETQSQKPDASPPPITHIALFVSQCCNLKCGYCYGGQGTYGQEGLMSTDIAIEAVRWLIEQSQDQGQLGITFFGGEPLLNFAVIQEVVQYAADEGRKNNKDFEFGITTNGTLIDDDIIRFMQHNGINPIVSFDGLRYLQDKQRPFKDGRGSYDVIVNNLSRLLKVIPNTICRTTIVDASLLAPIEEQLREIGFRRIQFSIASPSLFKCETKAPSRNVEAVIACLPILTREIVNAVRSRNGSSLEVIKYSGLGWHLMRMVEQLINQQKRYFACGAGKSGVAISASGDVYLCHRFVGTKKFILGSIYNPEALRRHDYGLSPTKHATKCSRCHAKYLCAGGCYHDNIGMTGSISHPARDLCLLMRSLTDHAVIIRHALDKKDIEYLTNEGIIDQGGCPLDLYHK